MSSLRALYGAYQQSGQTGKAFDFINRMVDVAMMEEDADGIAFVMAELTRFEESHPSEAAAQQARLRVLSATNESTASLAHASSGDVAEPPSREAEVDISEELALAWRLYEENQLSQEEYSSVLHDLTEISSKEVDVPVSVLHVLNDRGFTQMNRIMNYMSNRSGAPYLSLASFELTDQIVGVLPLEVAVHDGALPFAFFGNDLLVAVLNPFNNMLVDQVERLGGIAATPIWFRRKIMIWR